MTLTLANPTASWTNTVRAWRLPSAASLRVYLAYVAIVGCLFVVGYGGANWLAAQRDAHARLYVAAELAIPLWPEMIWAYLSINLLFVLPLFALDVEDLHRLGRRMIAATVVAVAVFLFMPTTNGFERFDLSTEGNPVFALLYALDRPFNCLPSLHVAYSTLLVGAITQHSRSWLRILLGGWLLLIMASTVLTHQHHVADIAAALLLVGALHLAFNSSPAPYARKESDT